VQQIEELVRQGVSRAEIGRLTGFDPKTIRKYLQQGAAAPRYGPRQPRPSKLDGFRPYIEERLRAGVWNAIVLLGELRQRGYSGGYTILKDYLQPLREAARSVAVRRFETPAGKQAQLDWGYLGEIDDNGRRRKLWAFVFTLGHSRAMVAAAATDQKLPTLLRLHEEAFRQLGGVPEEILYDRMKTVVEGIDERGETRWNRAFAEFARYWGFTPRACKPYRAQTKGKVESGVKYVRRNFLCGRTATSLQDLDGQLRAWVWETANRRVHGTTHKQVLESWKSEKAALQPLDGRPPYPLSGDEPRRVSRDAFVAWRSNRYSVPWPNAGAEVRVRERAGRLEVFRGPEKIAVHELAGGRHQTVRLNDHHADIPLAFAGPPGGRGRIHIQVGAPEVQVRSLAAYESAAAGGAL
jgi:transposase